MKSREAPTGDSRDRQVAGKVPELKSRASKSQIKTIKSPDRETLTLTTVKTKDGDKLRLNVGEMLLETGELPVRPPRTRLKTFE